jgi:hypothetical protein
MENGLRYDFHAAQCPFSISAVIEMHELSRCMRQHPRSRIPNVAILIVGERLERRNRRGSPRLSQRLHRSDT